MSETLYKRVAEIIAARKHISAEQISLDTTFAELGVDSLEALSLIYDFEDEFEVEIPNEEAAEIQNVRNAVEILERLGVAVA